MERLTDQQKNNYIRHKGNLCPKCESKNVESYDNEFGDGDGQFYDYGKCGDCGATWMDTYELINVEIDES